MIGGGQTAAGGVGVLSDDGLKFLRRTGSSVNSLTWPISEIIAYIDSMLSHRRQENGIETHYVWLFRGNPP